MWRLQSELVLTEPFLNCVTSANTDPLWIYFFFCQFKSLSPWFIWGKVEEWVLTKDAKNFMYTFLFDPLNNLVREVWWNIFYRYKKLNKHLGFLSRLRFSGQFVFAESTFVHHPSSCCCCRWSLPVSPVLLVGLPGVWTYVRETCAWNSTTIVQLWPQSLLHSSCPQTHTRYPELTEHLFTGMLQYRGGQYRGGKQMKVNVECSC